MASDTRPAEFEARARLLGQKVRHRHNELRWTEQRLVDATGLSRRYVQLLLNNRGSNTDKSAPPNPTIDVIYRLAKALEIDPLYLVDFTRDVESFPVPKN
ncbi:helix-turn-helix domain-containing protein [Nocardioides sp. Kera G14]|uniref:helix-turn-helix domain-containing protein n=1 Tax=Nocardioides sp. Kera G14 TaxID=2884264 RepID=UPI001D1256EF|nr:helix-turn-helix transcriptional regulator [Nocardioides sp. Kera G14]UDY22456.1 helix-turn-helix domain-containing protein [Nocardioides sp. Kera G14]